MSKNSKTKSRIIEAVLETASDLHRLGFIDAQRYENYLRLKVEFARSLVCADTGRSNDEVEADYAASRRTSSENKT